MWIAESGRMIAATPKILPAVYNDAMTYYEQLKILNAKLNECIETFNAYGGDMVDTAKQYTDIQIKALQQSITSDLAKTEQFVLNEIANLKASLQGELDSAIIDFKSEAAEIVDKLDKEADKLSYTINTLQVSINTLWEAFASYKIDVDKQIVDSLEIFRQEIERLVASKLGSEIIVQNPVTTTLTNLNQALSDLLAIVQVQGYITAAQYKSLNLTVAEYAALKITAIQYKYRGIWIFFKRLFLKPFKEDIDKEFNEVYQEFDRVEENKYMMSPFTFQKDLIKNVVMHLARLHQHYITVAEYKAENLTAADYEGLKLTAYEYVWDNPFYKAKTMLSRLESRKK